jgi:hypothetical protein
MKIQLFNLAFGIGSAIVVYTHETEVTSSNISFPLLANYLKKKNK